VWDIESGRCLQVLKGHAKEVTTVSLSIDGKKALSGSADGTVRLWDIERGQELGILEGHADRVRCVALSFDGLHALVGSDVVRMWNIERGHCVNLLEGTGYSVHSVAWCANGRCAFACAANGVMRAWSLSDATNTVDI
jgi:WD40 repeat protein